MIKILKNEQNNKKIRSCEAMEKDSWINLINPTPEEINKVAEETNINPSIISQVLVEKELPRIKKTEEATLVVIDIPYMKDKNIKNKYVTHPLGIIICNSSHLITVSLIEHEFLKDFRQEEVENFFTYKRNRFLIQIFLKASEAYLFTLNAIDEDIQKMEKSTYYSTNNKQLINFLNIQKTLVYFITSLKANEIALEKIAKGTIIEITKENEELLEDALIETKQAIETASIYREILSSMTDTYATIISNNLNDVMKFLAGITIVFSIPTMVASFIGMNVPLGSIGDSPFSFILIILFSVLLSLIIAYILKRKNML